MLAGVGVDLASIERIEKIYEKFPSRFVNRIFTEREKEAFSEKNFSMATLAARFAAKEAVLKAIGCGIGPAGLNEVEITATTGKQPEVRLYGEALRLAGKRNISNIALSMTHEPPFACAVAAAFSAPYGCN